MRQAKLNLYTIAEDFLIEHRNEHLNHDQRLLIDRCIAHLMAVENIPASTAIDTALQAIGERESRERLAVRVNQ